MGKNGGISDQTQAAEVQVAQGELGLGTQANQRAQQLFNMSLPGLEVSEGYYQALASGDPAAIARASAPAAQMYNQMTEGNAQRIAQDVPRGGAQNLALAENQINKGAQIGQAATQGYLNSFQNLAGLGGQSVGESGSFTNSAISGLSAAGNQYSNIANQQAEGKATQLGFIASLAGSGAEAAGAFCWIADELFGRNSVQAMTLRYYLLMYATAHWFGRMMVNLYRRYGERMAQRIHGSKRWRGFWLPIFERLLVRAHRALSEDEKRAIFELYWDINGAGKYATTR